MLPASIFPSRLRTIVRTGLKRASGLRLALLAALALAVTVAATVAPARPARSSPSVQRLSLPAPMGEMVRAHLDAVAPAPQPESSSTPSLEAVLNPDGSLWGGLSGSFNASGFEMTYGADGGPRFVPSGSSSPMAGGYASFVNNKPNSTLTSIAVIGSDMYVGGFFTNLRGIAEADYIAKWDGSAWSALGGGAQHWVYALTVSGSDVYVGGDFTSVYSSGTTSVTGTRYIAKWDGSAWSALGGGAQYWVYALGVSGSDVYVGGTFTTVYSSGTTPVDGTGFIAKWNGSAWSALGGGANGPVYALAMSGSDVYFGGGFTTVYSSGTTPVDGTGFIAKWNGSAWSATGPVANGANGQVRAIAVSGSDVYVGGTFTDLEGIAEADYVAKWDGSAWSALGGGAQGQVSALAVNGSDVYVGGRFSTVYSSGTTSVTGTRYIAKWNGSAWSALGGGASGNVLALAVNGSDVYVGGDFTSVYSSGTTEVTGTSRIAKWDGNAWAFGVPAGNGVSDAVQAIAVVGSDVYVGGHFTDLAGIAEADRIAKWDGSAWSALGGGASGAVDAIAVSGSDVYVGGSFSSVYSSGTTPVSGTSRMAKWDGSAWSALGGGAQNTVYALAVSGSDVYVGGGFTSVYSSGTTPVTGTSRIAKWDGSAWSALGGGAAYTVYALAVSGSDVYVGGDFTSVYSSGTTPVDGTLRIAKWNGSAWSALGGGASSVVLALAVNGSDVYAGGLFSSVFSSDTTPVAGTSRIAKWDGSTWSALGGGASGNVLALAVNGSDVYVGGSFTNLAGIAEADRIAKWDGSAWSALGGGVNGSVNTLILGNAEPAPGTVRGRGDAPAARAVQAAVPALYMGGDFTAAGDGTPMSYFSYYTGPEVLPVELVSFAATVQGRTAHLSWTTASETNNIGFVVERQTRDAWTDVSALIAGQGTTTERTDYTYDVANLTAGRHTFRLRQTDTDGTVHHSASVTIEIGTDGQTVVTILGNGSASPRVRIEGAGAVRAEVYDVLGRSVARVYDGEVSGTAEASLPSLSSGSYVVRVTTVGRMTSHTVVVR